MAVQKPLLSQTTANTGTDAFRARPEGGEKLSRAAAAAPPLGLRPSSVATAAAHSHPDCRGQVFSAYSHREGGRYWTRKGVAFGCDLTTYGWPADLSDEQIVSRLVALNAERAQEEERGLIRWLRPDYQRQRAGLADTRRETAVEEQIEAKLDFAETKTRKPLFPTGDLERTAKVFAALMQANAPLDAAGLARSFRQGSKVEPAISRVLASLARLGHAHSPDGRTFALRRVA